MSSTIVSIVSMPATDLSLSVALADEPRPLAAAAAEQRAHPRHVAGSRVTGHMHRWDLECLKFYSC